MEVMTGLILMTASPKPSAILTDLMKEKIEEKNESTNWFLAGLISIICVAFLVISIKICYNYSQNFPESKKNDDATVENLNRRAISLKGSRGVRYSVA